VAELFHSGREASGDLASFRCLLGSGGEVLGLDCPCGSLAVEAMLAA
jgi:hypothetical protein